MQKWVVNSLIVAVVAVFAAIWVVPDGRLRVIFCNVGQGDATLVQWRNIQLLIDGGPDSQVAQCLANHMPFYDHRIEEVVLTHPDSDHYKGLISVIQRYDVTYFVTGEEKGEDVEYRDLLAMAEDKKVKIKHLTAGERMEWKLGKEKLVAKTMWPTDKFLAEHLVQKENVLGADTDGTDLNRFSEVQKISFGNFEVLVTGDADAPIQPEMMASGGFGKVDVLKVPHHGSKTGLNKEWLEMVGPDLAIISVGKNNFGHPAPETIKMLEEAGVKVMRTDKSGDIVVISDGKKWWVK
jgi:competence protein ComEC